MHNKLIQGDLIEVQSPEGQQMVRRLHAERMGALEPYPTIRKLVHHDAWAEDHLSSLLSHKGYTYQLGHPFLYMAPRFEEMGIIPPGLLDKTEAALKLLEAKAPKSNLRDLIGNMAKSNSSAAVFEARLFTALSCIFGEQAVEPYPRAEDGSGKNVECAVVVGETRLYFEATVLMDNQREAQLKGACIEHNIPFPFRCISGEEGVERMIRKCKDKALERAVNGPLVLCLNQICTLPDPRISVQIIHEVVESADSDPQSPLVAISYFAFERYQATIFASAGAKMWNLNDELKMQIREAMEVY